MGWFKDVPKQAGFSSWKEMVTNKGEVTPATPITPQTPKTTATSTPSTVSGSVDYSSGGGGFSGSSLRRFLKKKYLDPVGFGGGGGSPVKFLKREGKA